jgi:heat shock 70kDa protein 4
MQIGPFQSNKSEKAKLKVKVRLNIHGIVSVDSATVISHASLVALWNIM